MKNKDFKEFYDAMKVFVPEDSRIMACQFRGDPNSDIYGKWRARTLRNPDMVDDWANVYLCVSAMRQNERGEWRRRKENFAGGLLLMIDDIGSGKGAKFPMDLISPLPPTALVETSPDNFQATYFFDSLIEDLEEFDSLIRAFIHKQFLGADTGQAGVNRVFRPPAGINGKEKYKRDGKPWKVVMHDFIPERRFSIREIAKAFNLDLVKKQRMPKDAAIINSVKAERIRAWGAARASLRSAAMLKKEEPDYSGWIQIVCPWTEDHSDRADTGAAIRVPAEENEWYGGFRCHHGHCEGKGWADMTQWLNEAQTYLLANINKNAPEKISWQTTRVKGK